MTVGKGKHKHVVGFQLDFNTPLNAAAAQDTANYSVVQQTNHGHKTVSHPVAFRAVYDATNNSVQLLLKGRAKLAQGGKVVVDPNSSAMIADARELRPAIVRGGNPATTIVITVLPGALAPAG